MHAHKLSPEKRNEQIRARFNRILKIKKHPSEILQVFLYETDTQNKQAADYFLSHYEKIRFVFLIRSWKCYDIKTAFRKTA